MLGSMYQLIITYVKEYFSIMTGNNFHHVITIHSLYSGGECQPSSRCCYTEAGNLLVGPPNGGTIDKVSPQGPYKCHLQNIVEDVLPAIYCCVGSFRYCEALYDTRPSKNSNGYRLPVPGEKLDEWIMNTDYITLTVGDISLLH